MAYDFSYKYENTVKILTADIVIFVRIKSLIQTVEY